LAQVVSRADVVITASRPRALGQLGLDAEAVVRHGRPRLWLMISGYGGTGASGHRVAFGDDAAVAGGLVSWDGSTPCFCGDAIADPLTGLAATAAVLAALEGGESWILEASMADIAGGVAGPQFPVEGLVAVPPRVGRGLPPAPISPLGADTDQVLFELGIS
jgi:crotonobetainyl-CoA:carnitine CoA-transferase CaiB-like acyl-CoA transferase